MSKSKNDDFNVLDGGERECERGGGEGWMRMTYEERMVEKARRGYVNQIHVIRDVEFAWDEKGAKEEYKVALSHLIKEGTVRVNGLEISLDYDGNSVRVVCGKARNYGGQLFGKLACEELSRLIGAEYENLWVPQRVFNEWMSLWRFTIDNISRQSMKISGLWFKIEKGKLEMAREYERYEQEECIEEESLMMLLTMMDCPLDVSFAVEQAFRYHASPVTEAKSMTMRGTYATQSVWQSFFCAGADVNADPVIDGTLFYHIKAEKETKVDFIVKRNRYEVMRTPFKARKGNNGNIRLELPLLSDKLLNFDVRKNYRDSMNLNFIWKARVPLVVSTTLWITYSKAYGKNFMTYEDYVDIVSMAYDDVVVKKKRLGCERLG